MPSALEKMGIEVVVGTWERRERKALMDYLVILEKRANMEKEAPEVFLDSKESKDAQVLEGLKVQEDFQEKRATLVKMV